MENNVINVSEFQTAYENLNRVLGDILILSDDYLLDYENVSQVKDINEKNMALAHEIKDKISEMEQIAAENEIGLSDEF